MTLEFPDGFLWGAATSAHQVEGANDNNDWWDWEQTPGHIQNGDTSAVACDWWKGERYRADFDLAESLNQNAHRFSVEWSRIEPREGEWDADALAFYRRVLTALRERGMTPAVTLHHFTNPRWLAHASRGAWETEAIVPLFERFATKVAQELGDLCDFWVTLNEPTVYMVSGYLDAHWPPGKQQSLRMVLRVGRNMLRAHAAAYHAIHRVQPQARVGIAHNLRTFRPENPNARLDRAVTQIQDYIFNRMFFLSLIDGHIRFPMGTRTVLPELVGTQDYIGLNYYLASRVVFDLRQPGRFFGRTMPAKPWGTSFDEEVRKWFGDGDLDPDGFCAMTRWLAQFGKPIYITENGICDAHDEIRPRVLITYLAALHRAIQQGAPVKGYFHWTLVDNFEWKEGWNLRFGLIANDPATQTRTPRPSARIYARIAQENGIADDLLERYGA
jgi:beta-glucosidase